MCAGGRQAVASFGIPLAPRRAAYPKRQTRRGPRHRQTRYWSETVGDSGSAWNTSLIRTAGPRCPWLAGRSAPSGSRRRPRWGVPRIADHHTPVTFRRSSVVDAYRPAKAFVAQFKDAHRLLQLKKSDGSRCRTLARMSAKSRIAGRHRNPANGRSRRSAARGCRRGVWAKMYHTGPIMQPDAGWVESGPPGLVRESKLPQ